jgi:hypothetical protein
MLRMAIAVFFLPFFLTVAQAGIYDADVPLQGDTPADRALAFSTALGEVAVRVSGDRGAASSTTVQSADAAKYVQRYSRTGDGQLSVGFDPSSVDRLMRSAGLPVWPSERPLTLVLLSVPAAATGGQAMGLADSTAERQELEAAARARGISLTWPRAGIDVAVARRRVVSGDPAEIAALKDGSGAQGLLIGLGSGNRVDWVFTEDGPVLSASGTGATGAHLAADAYAARYAPASTGSMSSFTVTVSGIDGLYAYAELLKYLESLSMVNRVSVQGMDRDVVRLIVTMRGDAQLLRRIALLDRHLVPAQSAGDIGTQASDYTFQP